jgi:exosortase/archaeosortase family protein
MARLGSLTLQAALALVVGFSLMVLPVVALAFDALARLLAVASAGILNVFGFSILRTGTELREALSGWAVDVTSVCDGHGLIFGWAAIVTAVRPGWRAGLISVGIGILAITVFNLIRIVVLASVLAHLPSGFAVVHSYIFPLLTALLMLVLARFVLNRPVSGLVVLLLIGLAVLWFWAGEWITAWTLVPIANGLLSLIGPEGIGTIALRAPGWTVDSTLIARADPLAFHMAGLNPNDFTLAVPVILACALMVRQGWPGMVTSLPLLLIALLLGTIAALWSVATANAVSEIAVPDGEGLRAVPYVLPGAWLTELVRLAQNVLVHLNLLVLPVLILVSGKAWFVR